MLRIRTLVGLSPLVRFGLTRRQRREDVERQLKIASILQESVACEHRQRQQFPLRLSLRLRVTLPPTPIPALNWRRVGMFLSGVKTMRQPQLPLQARDWFGWGGLLLRRLLCRLNLGREIAFRDPSLLGSWSTRGRRGGFFLGSGNISRP